MNAIGASNSPKSLRINYNKLHEDVTLKGLCGCDLCSDTFLQFDIKGFNNMINISCNNRTADRLSMKDTNNIHSAPLKMMNVSERLYITIGNIGPYTGENNVIVNHSKDQLIGCLDIIRYNDRHIAFSKNGRKIHNTCIGRCVTNICNDGSCIPLTLDSIACNCSFAVLNGPYCNQSMNAYNSNDNHSYKGRVGHSGIFVKLTFKPTFSHINYCLMEIIHGDRHATIWTSKDLLMFESTNISEINKDSTNFFNVRITNHSLFVKTKREVYPTEFGTSGDVRINIGFSTKSTSCETFYGAFDLYYDPSQILQIIPVIESTHTSSYTYTNSYTLSTTRNASSNIQPNVWIIITCFCVTIVIVVLLLCSVNLFVVLKIRNKSTSSNPVDPEPSGPKLSNNVEPSAEDVYSYSQPDYGKMYGTNSMMVTDESDGYILPSPQQILPPLPPRSVVTVV